MKSGDSCPPENFTNGVTNGAHWYEVAGTFYMHITDAGERIFFFFTNIFPLKKKKTNVE